MRYLNRKFCFKKNEHKDVIFLDDNYANIKLDGISFLLTHESGETRLYSRGNGKEGKDISSKLKDREKSNSEKKSTNLES